ncbi:glutamyl-tRNA amidotransferase [Mycena rebaudengoi]|nr:glutamyl-tRNA amidotransferase [Mycena rebaudengoi]
MLPLPPLCASRGTRRTAGSGARWPGWQVIQSRQKLFSTPNTRVSPFDAAFPGTLPNLNQKCVDLALRTAIALNATIQARSSFDRKHYFYSDLPAGYQITQHYAPIAVDGHLNLPNRDSPIRIKQIQLEQDTAKSTFDPRTRTWTGLLEIVTEPDIRSPEEAGTYVRALQAVLRAGSLRCDVNVSVNPIGQPPGTRCEIKNLNSVKFMQAAIASLLVHEVHRQCALLSGPDAAVPQETRGFNQDTFETFKMRSKEEAPDYRYMPDPNLGILAVPPERIAHITRTMPELPAATRARYWAHTNFPSKMPTFSSTLDSGREVGFDGEHSDGGAVAYFDRLCSEGRNPRVVFNWMVHELLGRLSAAKLTLTDNPLTTSQLGELVDLVQSGSITGTSGKLLLRHMLADPTAAKTPTEMAHSLSLISSPSSSTDDADLARLCAAAIAALPSEAAAFRSGHKNVLNKMLGWVMKESRGRAGAKAVKEQLILLLEANNENAN